MRRIELNQIIAAVLSGLVALLYLATTCMTISSPVLRQIGYAGTMSFSGADLIGQNFLAILPVLIAIGGAAAAIVSPSPAGGVVCGAAGLATLVVALCGNAYVGSMIKQYTFGISGAGFVYTVAPGFGCYLCIVLGIAAAVCCFLNFSPRKRLTSTPGVSVDEDDF